MGKVAPSGVEDVSQASVEVAAVSSPREASDEDRACVASLLGGDEVAFVRLVERYHASMIRVASAFVSSRAIAEEVTQDTWAAILAGLSTFEGRSSLKTWMFRILTNRAKTRGVREGRSVPLSALDEGDEGNAPPEARFTSRGAWASPPRGWEIDTPEALLLKGEMLGFLRGAIEALPDAQRAVLLLRDVEGFDSDEACNILGVSETNQRVLLHRARTRVRALIEERLGRS